MNLRAIILMTVTGLGLLDLSGEAQVYNVHLVTDNQPDYTDFDSFVQSSTGTWKTPEEKCIAVWRWGRRSRHQLSCSREGARYIMDPILNYNSYGALNCGIISGLNLCSWLELGYQARYVQLADHTVSQVSWDNGKNWHLFDSSMSFFCYNHAEQIASCEEIKEAHGCELSGGRVEPGHYYLYHPAPQCASFPGPNAWRCASDNPVEFERTLGNGAESYTNGFSVDNGCQYARYGHRYILNLHPYESYTRSWTPGDHGHLNPANKNQDYFRPLPNGLDPDGQKDICNLRANGEWILEPNFAEKDCATLFYDAAGVRLTSDRPRLRSAEAGRTNWVIFQVSAANIITSMRVDAEGLCAGGQNFLRISVSRGVGIRWQEVWKTEKSGPQSIHLKLRDEVGGVPFCWIKVEMSAQKDLAATGLDRLKVTTTTLLNRLTLPALTRGRNVVQLRADEPAETIELWPSLYDGKYKETVFAEDGVFSGKEPDGMYKATLGSGVDKKECSITWRLQAPSDILDVSYVVIATVRARDQWVSLQHSWDGEHFAEFHRHQDDKFPLDRRIAHVFKGADVPAGARQAFFRAVFFSPSGSSTYNMAGLQDLLIRIHHQPRAADFKPFEVTYNWTEHRESGDVSRGHTELVTKLPYRYHVNVAGRRDPTMNWVRMNLPGYGPNRLPVRYGYSDGIDVGPGCGYAKVSYRWGRNLALGKAYSASRPSSVTSGNPDTGGRELTDGILIAPTEYMTAKSVQPAAAFWDAGEPVSFVVDLGRPQPMAGVRVHTHQPNGRFCHPKTVEVAVSSDGQNWEPAGCIKHDDLWKPPGDYEPWEYDQGWKYAGLPAGGRLAYGFPLVFPKAHTGRYVRFICTPLEGRGLGMSELQVFDAVSVAPWPADIWLPDVASGK
ncbi:MAG: discoidin domain-containing protein [Limisphaerales bacterium]